MLRRSMLVLVVLMAAGPLVALGDDEASRLAEKLQGDWDGVEIEIQGTRGTEEEAKAVRISFKGDEVTVRANGPDRPGRRSTLKRLDPSKSPIEMDLLALERREKGTTQPCILSLEEGRLRICAPLIGDKRPVEFKTSDQEKFVLFTLKRAESKAKDTPEEPVKKASAPRYRLAPGDEIAYRSETTNGEGSYKVDWKVWVLDRDAEGAFPLVIRCDLTMTRKGSGAQQETRPLDSPILWKCRLFDDGRLVGATTKGTVRDPFRLFPKLPDGPDDLATFWESPGPETEEVVIRYKLAAKPEPGSPTLTFGSTRTGPRDTVYGMDMVARATFDAAKGLVTRVETEDASGYPKKSVSHGLIELVAVESKGSGWIEKFAADAKAYFSAVEAYESAYGRAGRDAGRCKEILDESKAKLKVAREAIETACFRDSIDQKLAQHDQGVEYQVEEANRRAGLVGKPAADWEAKDIDGKTHRMADYRGRVVVMDFWYRGCGWCMTAMPQVIQLADAFRDQPVSVLGMTIDEDEKDARVVIDAMKIRYPTIRAKGLPEKFAVQGYPTLIVVDRRGIIREVHVGYSPHLFEEISGLIRELLAEKPAE